MGWLFWIGVHPTSSEDQSGPSLDLWRCTLLVDFRLQFFRCAAGMVMYWIHVKG